MRRDALIESVLARLACVELAAERRCGEIRAVDRRGGVPQDIPSGLELLQTDEDVRRWRVEEVRKLIKTTNSALLQEWVENRAEERLHDIAGETDDRKRTAAAMEMARVENVRAEVTREGTPPGDALRFAPEAEDVHRWLQQQMKLIAMMSTIEGGNA